MAYRAPRVMAGSVAFGFVRQQSDYLAESRLFQYNDDPKFLRGFDSGVFDCGVLLSSVETIGTYMLYTLRASRYPRFPPRD